MQRKSSADPTATEEKTESNLAPTIGEEPPQAAELLERANIKQTQDT